MSERRFSFISTFHLFQKIKKMNLAMLCFVGTMIAWEVNEIPARLSVYVDVDGDNIVDEVWSYGIVYSEAVANCADGMVASPDMALFTTCPADHPYVYGVKVSECLRLRKEVEDGYVQAWEKRESQGQGSRYEE